jgi:hypothetical protein
MCFEFTPPHASWTVHRPQFPLRPAYATTFDGHQGLTVDKTVLDLHCDVFIHGQLYTALSHIRIRDDSLILFSDTKNDYDYNIKHHMQRAVTRIRSANVLDQPRSAAIPCIIITISTTSKWEYRANFCLPSTM